MDFLITESQLKTILNEEKSSKIVDSLKYLNSFTKELIIKAKKDWNLDFKFLITWGTAIGGFAAPLNHFIRTGDFNLTDKQITLILIGIISVYYYNNKSALMKILQIIKSEGIENEFKQVLSKSKELKNSFVKFMISINKTMSDTFSIMRYAFLIPIISDDIMETLIGGSDVKTATALIVKRLLAYGAITFGSDILSNVIENILKRLSK
jgi:hypothetical protein